MKLYIAAVHGRIVGTDQSRQSTLAVQRYLDTASTGMFLLTPILIISQLLLPVTHCLARYEGKSSLLTPHLLSTEPRQVGIIQPQHCSHWLGTGGCWILSRRSQEPRLAGLVWLQPIMKIVDHVVYCLEGNERY